MITHGTGQGGESNRLSPCFLQYRDPIKEGLLMKLRKKRDLTFYRIVPPHDFKSYSPNCAHVFVQSLAVLGLPRRWSGCKARFHSGSSSPRGRTVSQRVKPSHTVCPKRVSFYLLGSASH